METATSEVAEPELAGAGFPGTSEIVGGLAAVAPLFLSFSTSSSVTINGVVQAHRETDWIALVGGTVAVPMALWGLAMVRKSKLSARRNRLFASIAILTLGVYQVVHGFGVL